MQVPELWSEDKIEVREDGFLWVKEHGKNAEEQPLLLHSTEFFLQELYPSLTKESILKHKGYLEETKTEDAKINESSMEADGDAQKKPEEGSTIDSMEVDERPDGSDDNGRSKKTEEGSTIDSMKVDERPDESDDHGRSISSKDEGTEDSMQVDDKVQNESAKPKKGAKKAKKPKIPLEYSVYQNLNRCNNLADRITSVLLDIQYSRHRKQRAQDRERLSRDEVKLRAMSHQQQRLLSQQSSSAGESSVATNDEDDDEAEETDQGDDEEYVLEPPSIRLVRTINSIRALYPHLLPMLNHPRRNDKSLVIKSARYKSKKRAMCWIMGTKVFDTTTCRLCMRAHTDARLILEGYIDVDDAQRIADDPLGSPDYWSKSWIQQVKRRASPQILNPLKILAGNQDIDSIKSVACECDERLHLDSAEDNTPEIYMQYRKAVNKLHEKVSKLLTKRFPKARVSIYGSCLSNLSLGKGADVDLSLWIPEAEKLQRDFHEGKIGAIIYERDMKRFVYQACYKLKNLEQEFRGMLAITRARVPVITGTYHFAENPYSSDGSINFDVCFLNDIAVANSGLLREYSLVDPRVRRLMMAVKLWAKEYKINSAKDNYISSYAWINLVVFYLQCLGFIPNLQSSQLMEAVGVVPNPDGNRWHFVNKLHTCTLSWHEVEEAKAWTMPNEFDGLPVSALLYGFFEFYGCRFPTATFAVSIKKGDISVPKRAFKKVSNFYCIEDPFETFESHCPHDLGTPAGENGAIYIMKLMREAEAHLRDILCGKSKSERLWPDPPFAEPEASGQGNRSPNVARFAQQKYGANDRSNPSRQPMGQRHGRGRGGRGRGPHQGRTGRNWRPENQKGRPVPKHTNTSQGDGEEGRGQNGNDPGTNSSNTVAERGAEPRHNRRQGNHKQNDQKGNEHPQGGVQRQNGKTGKGKQKQNDQKGNEHPQGGAQKQNGKDGPQSHDDSDARDKKAGENKKEGGKPKFHRNRRPPKQKQKGTTSKPQNEGPTGAI